MEYQSYFKWLCSFVCNKHYPFHVYEKLLSILFEISYHCAPDSIDNNRITDGYSLRNRWLDEYNCASDLRFKPCSLLEVLIALSRRCEEDIMDNPEYGDRTYAWFWMMVENIGVVNCDFDDSYYIYDKAQNAMNHIYNEDGTDGGFITIPGCSTDLRNTDLWSQLMLYLDTYEATDEYI